MSEIVKKITGYFSKGEIILWIFSVTMIAGSFLIFDNSGPARLAASIIGVTAILFCAKGNPLGQGLMIIFCISYGFISYNYRYYGEMITYMGMSMPMAIASLITWLGNPYNNNSRQVKVNSIGKAETVLMCFLAAAVTVVLYFVLRYFRTENLTLSTVSVTTSFIAVYLTCRRSPFFALVYGLNDIVLVILWGLAAMENTAYLSVMICFAAFLINDFYCFISWKSMEKNQLSKVKK